MRILLLSAYDAYSHQYWRNRLSQLLSDIEWTSLTLPARYFSWRIRGNGLSWGAKPSPIFDQTFDLCLATSMVDIATLRGLVPELTKVPTLYYFHENQFAYPLAKMGEDRLLEPQMVQLYGSLAADKLAFNSAYNMESFLAGAGELLKKLPDHVPEGVIASCRAKSSVLPVPVSMIEGQSLPREKNSFVWNHRWEYDKGPDRLLAFLQALPATLDLTFHITGQSFRQVPEAFSQIRSCLEERGWLGQWGFIDDKNRYYALLKKSQFVLSTAEHDFQGIAVLEAVSAGCVPILPNRLAYQELFPKAYRYDVNADSELEASSMVSMALTFMRSESLQVPDVSAYSGEVISHRYRNLFQELLA